MEPANRSLPVTVLLAGVVLILVGQFFMDALAESSDAWHWIEHGALSLGGVAAGAGLVLLYEAGQRRR
jgi:hypothetical protein